MVFNAFFLCVGVCVAFFFVRFGFGRARGGFNALWMGEAHGSRSSWTLISVSGSTNLR
jgi:hypothetical protein